MIETHRHRHYNESFRTDLVIETESTVDKLTLWAKLGPYARNRIEITRHGAHEFTGELFSDADYRIGGWTFKDPAHRTLGWVGTWICDKFSTGCGAVIMTHVEDWAKADWAEFSTRKSEAIQKIRAAVVEATALGVGADEIMTHVGCWVS